MCVCVRANNTEFTPKMQEAQPKKSLRQSDTKVIWGLAFRGLGVRAQGS